MMLLELMEVAMILVGGPVGTAREREKESILINSTDSWNLSVDESRI